MTATPPAPVGSMNCFCLPPMSQHLLLRDRLLVYLQSTTTQSLGAYITLTIYTSSTFTQLVRLQTKGFDDRYAYRD